MIQQYLISSLLAILASLIIGIIGLIIMFITIDKQDDSHPAMTEEQVKEIIKNTKK